MSGQAIIERGGFAVALLMNADDARVCGCHGHRLYILPQLIVKALPWRFTLIS